MDEDTPIGSEITTLLGELNRTVDQRVRKLEKAVARQAPRDGFLPDDVSPGYAGHASVMTTFDRDGHLFPSSMNADREKLDEYWREAGRHTGGTPRNDSAGRDGS